MPNNGGTFPCTVRAARQESTKGVACYCTLDGDSITFRGSRYQPIPITSGLFVDEFGNGGGVSIGNDDTAAIVVVMCDDPVNLASLVDSIVNSIFDVCHRQNPGRRIDADLRYKVHRGSLHSACQLEDLRRLKAILAETPSFSVDRQDENGQTALHIACRRDFKAGIEALIKAGADAACVDKLNMTPLHISCSLGHANTVLFMLLVGTGIIPAEFEADSSSPVWLASCSDFSRAPACVSMLLQHGFSADIVADGMHLLHVCIAKGKADVVEELLVEGRIDPNVLSGEGLSPLHYAVRSASTTSLSMVKVLLWAGAYPNYPSHDSGKNCPLHLCTQKDIAMALVSHGARTDTVNAAGEKATHRLGVDYSKRLSSTGVARWMRKRSVAILFCPATKYKDCSIECRLCQASFMPLFGRKHHCRVCGNLVCDLCSQKRATFSTVSYRTCDACFNRAIEAVVAFQMDGNLVVNPDSPPNELVESPPSEAERVHHHGDDGSTHDPLYPASQTVSALQDRQVALDQMQHKTSVVRDSAAQFATLAERVAAKLGGGR